MYRVRGVENLHSVQCHGTNGIGVTCNACRHRDVVTYAMLVKRFVGLDGNMRELKMIRFHCTACGGRWLDRDSFSVVIFDHPEEHVTFLSSEGDDEA